MMAQNPFSHLIFIELSVCAREPERRFQSDKTVMKVSLFKTLSYFCHKRLERSANLHILLLILSAVKMLNGIRQFFPQFQRVLALKMSYLFFSDSICVISILFYTFQNIRKCYILQNQCSLNTMFL